MPQRNQDPTEYPHFLVYWLRALGGDHTSIQTLTGGINSSVYAFKAGIKKFIIKSHIIKDDGACDKLKAETEFLKYAHEVAPHYVPRLIADDFLRRCLVLEYIEGRVFKDGESLSSQDIQHAIEFFRRLNYDRDLARTSITVSASDGYLSVFEHIESIGDKIGAMSVDHLIESQKVSARNILETTKKHFAILRCKILENIERGEIKDRIDQSETYVSPSDFGFHNAIRTTDGVKFLDFEFAGWDDPAKTVLDFNLQPRIPVKENSLILLDAIDPNRRIWVRNRCRHLAPVLFLKWTCIILAVLNLNWLSSFMKRRPNIDLVKFVDTRLSTANVHIMNREKFLGLS